MALRRHVVWTKGLIGSANYSASSLSQLTQLANVVNDEMSLTKPRAHPTNVQVCGRPFLSLVPDYPARHQVLRGITGWSQVNGWHGETIVEEQVKQRMARDLYCIENWSLASDIPILLLTFSRQILLKSAF